METGDKQDRDNSARCRQQCCLAQGGQADRRQRSQPEGRWRDAEALGDLACHCRRNDAGQKRRVVDDAHGDDLHAEDRRCHRGAEQGGKQGAHPGNGDDMQVLLVEPDQAAQGCADAAADLQRRALPPG